MIKFLRTAIGLVAALGVLALPLHGQDYFKAAGAGGASFTGGSVASPMLAPDGTALLPAYSFTSEPTLGFWRSTAGAVTLQGAFLTTGGYTSGGNIVAATAGFLGWANSKALLASPANGVVTLTNSGATIGSQLKADALPTVASGFGTSPAVTAGSTPLAGSVNVGTGAPGTGGVITFNGTAYPSAPFVVCMNQTTVMAVRCVATTTQLTIAATALTASDVVVWHAISSK